jgi:hypothetical protein
MTRSHLNGYVCPSHASLGGNNRLTGRVCSDFAGHHAGHVWIAGRPVNSDSLYYLSILIERNGRKGEHLALVYHQMARAQSEVRDPIGVS